MSEFGGGAAGPGEFRRSAGEQPLPAELRGEAVPDAAITAPDDWDDSYSGRDGVLAEDPEGGAGDLDDLPPGGDGIE